MRYLWDILPPVVKHGLLENYPSTNPVVGEILNSAPIFPADKNPAILTGAADRESGNDPQKL